MEHRLKVVAMLAAVELCIRIRWEQEWVGRDLRGQEDNFVDHSLGEFVGLDPPTQETHGFAVLQLGASPVNADEHVVDDLLVV